MTATLDTNNSDISLNCELPSNLTTVHPDLVSGAPCFAGTRVPIKNLFDYLEGGESLEDFLEGFPGVSRQQALGVLHLAAVKLLNSLKD